MLLLKVLYDRSAEEDREKLRRLIYPGSGVAGESIQTRLTPQDADLPSFCAVVEGAAPGEQAATANPMFAQAYALFSQLAQERPLAVDDVKSAFGRMHLAFIELDRRGPDHDDPQTIFEKMNAEGKNLEVQDLIRNYVFLLAAEKADGNGSERTASASSKQRSLYLNEWQNFENEFPGRAFGQMKHFFRDYLVIKSGELHPGSGPELYDRFKVHLQKAYPEILVSGAAPPSRHKVVEKIANEIWSYASAWTKVAFGKELKGAWEAREPLQKQIKDFSLIGHDPYYPLATLLFVHGQSEPKLHSNLAVVLEMLNKFLAVSELTGTTINFRQELLVTFIGSAEREHALKRLLETPAAFKAKLLTLWPVDFDPATALRQALVGGLQREADTMPEEEETLLEPGSAAQTREEPPADGKDGGDGQHPSASSSAEIPSSDPPPDVYGRRATAFLLLRINEKIMKDANDTAVQYLEPDHTLEHIMPQTIEKAEGWSGLNREFHRSNLHTLGNMTLAGRGFNSSISNRPLARKLDYYTDSSYGLTRRLAVEIREQVIRGASAESIDWGLFEQFLRRRTRRLADLAISVLDF